jgi:hypothetical protein
MIVLGELHGEILLKKLNKKPLNPVDSILKIQILVE